MFALGAGLLGHGLLPDTDREVVIARVTVRAGCRYEWGVHVAAFAHQVGLTPSQVHATTEDDATGATDWEPRHQALLRAVDELHDTSSLSAPTWAALRPHYDDPQLLELLVLVGWYRTIGLVANALLIDDEPWAAPYPGHPGPDRSR